MTGASPRRSRTAPSSVADEQLARALGLALTGKRLPLTAVADLDEQLAAAGFDRGELMRLRAERQESKAVWPFAVPIEERRALGFARFDAALAEARRELGLTGFEPRLQAERPLNRDEQRLSADRPPHW